MIKKDQMKVAIMQVPEKEKEITIIEKEKIVAPEPPVPSPSSVEIEIQMEKVQELKEKQEEKVDPAIIVEINENELSNAGSFTGSGAMNVAVEAASAFSAENGNIDVIPTILSTHAIITPQSTTETTTTTTNEHGILDFVVTNNIEKLIADDERNNAERASTEDFEKEEKKSNDENFILEDIKTEGDVNDVDDEVEKIMKNLGINQ